MLDLAHRKITWQNDVGFFSRSLLEWWLFCLTRQLLVRVLLKRGFRFPYYYCFLTGTQNSEPICNIITLIKEYFAPVATEKYFALVTTKIFVPPQEKNYTRVLQIESHISVCAPGQIFPSWKGDQISLIPTLSFVWACCNTRSTFSLSYKILFGYCVGSEPTLSIHP